MLQEFSGIKIGCLLSMKSGLLLLVCIVAHCRLWGQQKNATERHYYKTGQLSTIVSYDKDNRWGKAIAYNKAGKQIYEWELRRIAGHASVHFSYNSEGGVEKAEWSSAPDGGIQWYHTTTYFNPDGTINHEVKDNWDDRVTVPNELKQTYVVLPPEPKPIRITINYTTEYWFINRTPHRIKITATAKDSTGKQQTYRLSFNDSLKGGTITQTNNPDIDPQQFYNFTAEPIKKKHKTDYLILRVPADYPKQAVERRVYYVVL